MRPPPATHQPHSYVSNLQLERHPTTKSKWYKRFLSTSSSSHLSKSKHVNLPEQDSYKKALAERCATMLCLIRMNLLNGKLEGSFPFPHTGLATLTSFDRAQHLDYIVRELIQAGWVIRKLELDPVTRLFTFRVTPLEWGPAIHHAMLT